MVAVSGSDDAVRVVVVAAPPTVIDAKPTTPENVALIVYVPGCALVQVWVVSSHVTPAGPARCALAVTSPRELPKASRAVIENSAAAPGATVAGSGAIVRWSSADGWTVTTK